MNAVVHTEAGIIHSPERTAISAKTIIVRTRRRKQITALEARRAWTSIESDGDSLSEMLGTIHSYPAVFGHQYWTVVRGVSMGPVLWRDAIESFVRDQREAHGALENETWPPIQSGSIEAFLRDAAPA